MLNATRGRTPQLCLSVLCAVLMGCSGGDGETNGNGGDAAAPPTGPACPAVAYAAVTTGCTMTIRTPADCAVVSIGAEFAWEADACHTPYYLQIAGTPPSEYNFNDITVNTEPINALAWAEPLRAEYLAGLSTSDGWYHWRICNAYETGCSASRAFRLK